MGRALPVECEHGRVLDWGDFGPDEDGSVGTEGCTACERPRKWQILVEWKPQDCWIGVFWKRSRGPFGNFLDVWVCLLPMLPIHFSWGVISDG